jgi:recombination protein RecA
MATLSRPIDMSKFLKGISKSIPNISTGFNDPSIWVSTGSYLLNKLISNDFNKGIPLGKVTMFGGESGSGKSYICSGNVVKNAQDQGIYVVLIDTENALDESWLKLIGIDTDPSKILRISATFVNDVAHIIHNFVDEYKANYGDMPKEDRPKVLFIIDSLGMLMTPVDIEQFSKGDMKGDMGHFPKQLKKLVKGCINMFGDLNIGLLVTNHTYASQDMFNPDPKISGGDGFTYGSSIVIAMRKGKLKAEPTKDDPKKKGVAGIRAMFQVNKSRYAKPFEKAELEIPYDSGMDPYTGLIEFFLNRGVFTKDGNRYVYTDKSGTVHKEFEKNISNDLLDKIMIEWEDDLYGFKGSNTLDNTNEEIETSKE